MATFSAQITDLVGGTIDQTACDQWAADACKEIIHVLPDKLKTKCSAATTLNNSTTVMDMDAVGKILFVTRLSADSGGYQIAAREIPSIYGGLATDSTDLNYYGTASDPVYWVDGNTSDAATLYVKPTPTSAQTSIVHHISYPTVDVDSDSTIANFPDEAEYLVVLYASIKQLHQYMNSKRSDLPSDIVVPVLETISESLPTWSAPSDFVAPVKPAVPSLSVQSVSITGTAPTYVKPVRMVQIAFSGYTSGLSETDPGTLSISAVIPVLPSPPSFTTPTIGAVTVGSTTITNLGVAPTYTKPSLTSRGSFNTFFESGSLNPLDDSDPGVITITAVPPTVPTLTSISFSSIDSDVDAYLPTYTTATVSAGSVYGSNTQPSYTKPSVAPDFAQVNTYIDTNEDVELASAKLQEISAQLNEYSSNIQNEQVEFNKESMIYQTNIQEAMQEIQVANQVNIAKAQGELQLNIDNENRSQQRVFQNAINDMKVIFDNNAQSIQKYQSEASTYQANINKEVQEYGHKLSRYSTELGTVYQAWAKTESDSFQQYSTDIQNELNEFSKENTIYQVKLQESIQQAQLNAQKAQQQAQLDSTDAQQEASLLLQKENQEYSVKLQKYQAEVGTYGADVSKQVQEYGQKLSQYQLELNTSYQAWAKTESDNISIYQADVQNELNEFNKENVEYQAKLQKDIQDAQLSDANEARKLQKYQAEVGTYGTEVNTNVQTFTNAITKNKAAFDTSLQKYTSEVQKVSASNGTILQKFTGEVSDFSAKLQKQTTDYQWYQGQYAALRADYQQGLQTLIGGGAPAQQQ